MNDYVGICIPANFFRGKEIVNGEMGFHKTNMIFYYPSMLYHKEKVEIDYSQIVWIEKKKSYGRTPNKMTVYTKEKGEYTFVVNERDKILEFLDSKTKYATEKPMAFKERLHNIPGEKIRRQYFNIPIYVFLVIWGCVVCLVLPVLLTISSFIEVLEALPVVMIFVIPLLVLSLLNRFAFGRIVCVIDAEGIHYEHGFIQWKKINRIEYEIELPSRSYRRNYCFARILGEKIDAKLVHAPYYFVKKAKKYNGEITVGFSKGSKFLMVFFPVIFLVCGIIVLLFGL